MSDQKRIYQRFFYNNSFPLASVNNDFMAHCVEHHAEKFAQAIFGMPDEINDPDDGSWKGR